MNWAMRLVSPRCTVSELVGTLHAAACFRVTCGRRIIIAECRCLRIRSSSLGKAKMNVVVNGKG
jgi:hypothetical protein